MGKNEESEAGQVGGTENFAKHILPTVSVLFGILSTTFGIRSGCVETRLKEREQVQGHYLDSLQKDHEMRLAGEEQVLKKTVTSDDWKMKMYNEVNEALEKNDTIKQQTIRLLLQSTLADDTKMLQGFLNMLTHSKSKQIREDVAEDQIFLQNIEMAPSAIGSPGDKAPDPASAAIGDSGSTGAWKSPKSGDPMDVKNPNDTSHRPGTGLPPKFNSYGYGVPSGFWGDIDVDFFYCELSGEPAKAVAERFRKRLELVSSAGCKRVRKLPAFINARAGYQKRGYTITFNKYPGNRDEKRFADSLKTLGDSILHADPVMRNQEFQEKLSQKGTPYYLSVFVCPE